MMIAVVGISFVHAVLVYVPMSGMEWIGEIARLAFGSAASRNEGLALRCMNASCCSV